MDIFYDHCVTENVDDDIQSSIPNETSEVAKQAEMFNKRDVAPLNTVTTSTYSFSVENHTQPLQSREAEFSALISEHAHLIPVSSPGFTTDFLNGLSNAHEGVFQTSPFGEVFESAVTVFDSGVEGHYRHYQPAPVEMTEFITPATSPVNEEKSKKECLSIILRVPELSKRAKMEISKCELQDIYSRVYFEVKVTNLNPVTTSICCQQVYEREFASEEDRSIELSNRGGETPREKKSEWQPTSISKSIGQEKYNLFSSSESLCGMINFRNKGAWKRTSSREMQDKRSRLPLSKMR